MNMDIKQNNTEYTIRLAEEKDTTEILEFINRYKKGNNIEMNNNIFRNVLLSNGYYNNLNVRFNLYNFFEEFILIENKGIIKTLIAIKLPNNLAENLSKVFELNLFLIDSLDVDLLKLGIQYAVNYLPKVSIILPTKIRTFIDSDNNYAELWSSILNKIGFVYKFTRENEFDSNRKIKVFEIDTTIVTNKELEVC